MALELLKNITKYFNIITLIHKKGTQLKGNWHISIKVS